jgi:hypothetical protein
MRREEKLTSAKCKETIVAEVRRNPNHIIDQFEDEIVDVTPALNVKNWKRFEKETVDNIVTRGFDCYPYDDQLRAYVTSEDDIIISVVIQGE